MKLVSSRPNVRFSLAAALIAMTAMAAILAPIGYWWRLPPATVYEIRCDYPFAEVMIDGTSYGRPPVRLTMKQMQSFVPGFTPQEPTGKIELEPRPGRLLGQANAPQVWARLPEEQAKQFLSRETPWGKSVSPFISSVGPTYQIIWLHSKSNIEWIKYWKITTPQVAANSICRLELAISADKYAHFYSRRENAVSVHYDLYDSHSGPIPSRPCEIEEIVVDEPDGLIVRCTFASPAQPGEYCVCRAKRGIPGSRQSLFGRLAAAHGEITSM